MPHAAMNAQHLFALRYLPNRNTRYGPNLGTSFTVLNAWLIVSLLSLVLLPFRQNWCQSPHSPSQPGLSHKSDVSPLRIASNSRNDCRRAARCSFRSCVRITHPPRPESGWTFGVTHNDQGPPDLGLKPQTVAHFGPLPLDPTAVTHPGGMTLAPPPD